MIFDTDILIWMLRGYSAAGQLVNKTDIREISLQSQLELFQGVKSKRELLLIKSILHEYSFNILPLSENIGHRAAIYIEEFSLSNGLEAGDAIIAATAVEHNQILATSNVKHFKFIPGLELKTFKP